MINGSDEHKNLEKARQRVIDASIKIPTPNDARVGVVLARAEFEVFKAQFVALLDLLMAERTSSTISEAELTQQSLTRLEERAEDLENQAANQPKIQLASTLKSN